MSEYTEHLARLGPDTRLETALENVRWIFREFTGTNREKVHMAEELLDALDGAGKGENTRPGCSGWSGTA